MECHQCQPQWIQERKFGQLQPDWFAPTKTITLDTIKAAYLNSSQLEIDLSFRKQNYHKSRGFVASLSLVDSYCWITNFFHMVKPGTKSFLLLCLFGVFCQTVTTWFELTLMALPKLFFTIFSAKWLDCFQSRSCCFWFYAYKILAQATQNPMLWSNDPVFVWHSLHIRRVKTHVKSYPNYG